MKRSALVLLTGCLFACGNVINEPGSEDPEDPAADAGTDDPAIPTTEITILGGQVHDERGDQIDFSTGEPVHTHAGDLVELVATGCPTIYKYSYLLDANPAFGRQVTQNPLAWRVKAPNAVPLDDTASAYRVMTESGAVVRDWTSLAAPSDDVYTVELDRSDVPTAPGVMNLDVRFRDQQGTEKVARVCWTHQPLAAPLAFEAPRAATTPDALFPMTLAADSPILGLLAMSPSTGTDIVEQRVVQQTAEPITLTIGLTAPSATFEKTIVDDYVAVRQYTSVAVACDNEFNSSDPRCHNTLADPPDAMSNGAVASATWRVTMIDELTGATVSSCTHGTRIVTCLVPGRPSGTAPVAYRIIAQLYGVQELWPTGVPSLQVLSGLSFIGATSSAKGYICTDMRARLIGEELVHQCMAYTEYQRVIALDRARLNLASITLSVTTDGVALPYLPAWSTGALSWDSGDDDLPGIH